MKPSRFRFRISLRLLLLLVTAIALWFVFFVSLQTTKLTIPGDCGAYMGGIPADGDLIEIIVVTDNKTKSIVKGVRVVGAPNWRFQDGVAMTLKVKTTLYQQGKIRRYKYHRISNLPEP